MVNAPFSARKQEFFIAFSRNNVSTVTEVMANQRPERHNLTMKELQNFGGGKSLR